MVRVSSFRIIGNDRAAPRKRTPKFAKIFDDALPVDVYKLVAAATGRPFALEFSIGIYQRGSAKRLRNHRHPQLPLTVVEKRT